MRPDQHKKKKNSAYKKKHGIVSDKGEKHDKNVTTGSNRSGETSASAEPRAKLVTEDADEQGQHSTHERGVFSRRKLESNWDRYKEEEFDEFVPNGASHVSSIAVGADYQSLLDKTSNASSHFQFNSEREWENLNNDEINLDNKAGSSLLSIDCYALAQSLRNISLEERLEIDKKYFEDEYRESNTERTQPNSSHCYDLNDQESTRQNNTVLARNTIVGSSGQPNELNKRNNKFENPFFHPSKSPKELTTQHHSRDSENNRKEVQISVNLIDKPSTKSDEEDDLGLLLGFDNDKELHAMQIGNQTGDMTTSRTNKTDITPTAQKPQTSGDTKDDLEDWLDSILD